MNRLLALSSILLLNTTLHATPTIKVYMDYHNPLCNRATFNQEVNSNGFAPTTAVIPDYEGIPRAEVTAKVWEVKRTPLLNIIAAKQAEINRYEPYRKKPRTKAIADKLIAAAQAVIDAKKQELIALDTLIMHQIEDNTQCLVFEGTNEPYVPELFAEVPVGAIEGSLGYTEFENKYPLKGNAPDLYLLDSQLFSEFVHPNHMGAIAPDSRSFIDSSPKIFASGAVPKPTHGATMLFQAANLSDALIHYESLSLAGGGLVGDIPRAINWAATSGTHGVINMSFGRTDIPLPLEQRVEQELAWKNDMVVIRAIGNTGAPVAPTVKDDPSAIYLGFLVEGELKSAYGNNGPDLVIEEDGDVPVFYAEALKAVQSAPFHGLQSSGAAVIDSAIVSRMRNACPKATAEQVKDALYSTAIKIPEVKGSFGNRDAIINAKNKFVRYGIVDPIGATDKLMATVCKTKTSWTYYTPGGNLNNRTGQWNPKVVPDAVAPMAVACAELEGTLQPIGGKGEIYCTKTGAALHPNICLGVTGPERGVIKPCNNGLPTS